MRHARYAAYVFVVTMLCVSIQAQSQYKVLWTFAGGSADGATPLGNLILDRLGNLYGTTYSGGNTTAPPCSGAGCGTVFQLSPNPDGTWTNNILYAFCANYSNSACLDGAFPHAGLLIDGNGNLYGTTTVGGMPSNADLVLDVEVEQFSNCLPRYSLLNHGLRRFCMIFALLSPMLPALTGQCP